MSTASINYTNIELPKDCLAPHQEICAIIFHQKVLLLFSWAINLHILFGRNRDDVNSQFLCFFLWVCPHVIPMHQKPVHIFYIYCGLLPVEKCCLPCHWMHCCVILEHCPRLWRTLCLPHLMGCNEPQWFSEEPRSYIGSTIIAKEAK